MIHKAYESAPRNCQLAGDCRAQGLNISSLLLIVSGSILWQDLGNISTGRWQCFPKYTEGKCLQRVQNYTAWLVTHTHKCEHITPVFNTCIGAAPQCVEELVVAHHLTRSPRFEFKSLITVPQTFGNWFSRKALSTLWNSILVVDAFKKVMRNLFISAFLT